MGIQTVIFGTILNGLGDEQMFPLRSVRRGIVMRE